MDLPAKDGRVTPELRTARLRLRAPVATDAGWIARDIAHPGVYRKLTSPPCPYRLEHAQDWLSGQRPGNRHARPRP